VDQVDDYGPLSYPGKLHGVILQFQSDDSTVIVTVECDDLIATGEIKPGIRQRGELTLFIGDHGMSQAAQARVAAKLTREWSWAWSPVRVHQIDKYYDDSAQVAELKKEGETPATIGEHASLIDTSELMSVSPASVDLTRLSLAKGNIASVGGSGDPSRASFTRGAQLLKMRIDAAIEQIRAVVRR